MIFIDYTKHPHDTLEYLIRKNFLVQKLNEKTFENFSQKLMRKNFLINFNVINWIFFELINQERHISTSTIVRD